MDYWNASLAQEFKQDVPAIFFRYGGAVEIGSVSVDLL